MAWVCHMEKYKASDTGGIGAEDDRSSEKINEKNPNLDADRTHLNIHRMQTENGYEDTKFSHLAKIFGDKKAEINQLRKANGKTKIRKDAVVCNSFMITEDHSFFEDMSREECVKFFETAVDWFNQEFGNNVLQYSIHFDEYTPHMHMRVVPQKEDNLCSKEMFDRVALRRMQTELPEWMREHGFEVGEPEHDSVAVHRNEAEQRVYALNEKAERLEKKLVEKQLQLDWFKQETDDWRTAKKTFEGECEELRTEITSLKAQIRSNQSKIEEQEEILRLSENKLESLLKHSEQVEKGILASYEIQDLLTQVSNLADVLNDEYTREVANRAEKKTVSLSEQIQNAEKVLKTRRNAFDETHGRAVKRDTKRDQAER